MSESSPMQVGFNGGKFDALMTGRADVARYRYACREITNFIPTVQGPALKRSGTRFVKQNFDRTKTSRLIPFEYSRDQAYVLEFGDNAIRFMRDSGGVLETAVAISAGTPPTIANPCVITTNVAHGYATGDEVFITGSRLAFLNDQFFTVTVTGASTFTVSQYGAAAISSVGESLIAAGTNTVARSYQLSNGVSSNSVPWNYDELDAIQVAQDGDVLYIVHPLYPPHKLVRTSDTSWTCTAITFKWPAFRDENTSTTTMYVSAATGTAITVTASASTFTADMVGGYIKIGELVESKHPTWVADDTMASYYGGGGVSIGDDVTYLGRVYRLTDKNGSAKTGHSAPIHEEGIENDNSESSSSFEWQFINRGWGLAKITGYTSATVITVDVNTYGIEFPASVVTSGGATKKWAISAFNAEYGYPSAVALHERRLWLGGTERDTHTFWGSRTNLYDTFEQIPALADSGVAWTIANHNDAIQWMIGQDRLVIGTRGGEVTAESESQDDAITPDNIKVRQRSAFGSADSVTPILVDSALLMVHRNGRRLHEIIYDINIEKNNGADLTSMCPSILGTGARALAYQPAPHRQVHVVTADGGLSSLTYAREEEVIGWGEFASETPSGQSTVESVAVIPHPDGDQDQVWLLMNRTLASGTRRWIEIVEKPFLEGNSIADAFFVDAGATYYGVPTTTINGLLHLAGETVDYLTGLPDVQIASGVVSSKGKLTTLSSVTKIHIGFTVTADLETMDFEAGQPPISTSQGRRGRVVGTVVRVHNTGAGLYYGQRLSGTLDLWEPPTEMISAGLVTGDSVFLTLPGGHTRNQRVAIRHSTPLPCTIVALMPKITTEGN